MAWTPTTLEDLFDAFTSPYRYAWAYRRWIWLIVTPWVLLAIGGAALKCFTPAASFNSVMPFATGACAGVTALWAIAVNVYGVRVQRKVLESYKPICPGCGYTLIDMTACPECGVELSMEARKQAWRDAGYEVK